MDGDLAENYAQVVWSDRIDNDKTKFNAAFDGAVYEDEGGWVSTPAETFKLARQHFHLGMISCMPLAYDQQGNRHCIYSEAEAIQLILSLQESISFSHNRAYSLLMGLEQNDILYILTNIFILPHFLIRQFLDLF